MYVKCSSLLELILLVGRKGVKSWKVLLVVILFSLYSVKIIMFLFIKSQLSIQGRCQDYDHRVLLRFPQR